MTDTVHLGLPYIETAQAQKHVTHNEALRALDALVMLSVIDRDLSAPPAEPEEGGRYLVKAAGTGAFAGMDNRIAHFIDGGWTFFTPRAGWICFVEDEGALLAHDGDGWGALDVLGDVSDLQELTLLGVGTTADAVNPFAAKLNNALWAAREVADGGDGDLRYKLSKETAENTLSMLFQTDYCGRAEIGLTGDDDFHFKTSPDGTSWIEALHIETATGKVSFPGGAAGLREMLTAARTYYVRTDGDDANDGLANTPEGAWATLQHAADVVFGTLDLGGQNVIVQIGDGTYTSGLTVVGAQVGAGTVTFQGNAGDASAVKVTTTAASCFNLSIGAALIVQHMQTKTIGSGAHFSVGAYASVKWSNINFDAAGGNHVAASDHAYAQAIGNYSIIGSPAVGHLSAQGSVVRVQSRLITLTGTPSFPGGFGHATIGGRLIANGNTFSGAATGKRFNVENNSVIFTGGASTSYFPGDASGTTGSGGQYV